MNKFESDFEFYTNLILSDENFAYARYADGEISLMQGKPVGHASQAFVVDKWSSTEGITNIGEELLQSLKHTESNYHYAISGISDSVEHYQFLMSHIKNTNVTFANLWINANYQKMKNFYLTLKKEIYLICNHRATPEKFPFSVKEIFPFPDDCINYFLVHGEDYTNQLLEYTDELEGETIFVSAGPISEILIHRMYCNNPHNQYTDVGSSIDEFVHQKITRPYMDVRTPYSKEISHF